MQIMDNKEFHVCPFKTCGKTFFKKSRLAIHVRSHTGERPYKCEVEVCGKCYKRVDQLNRHRQVSHRTESDVHLGISCDESDCDARFQTVYSLNKHVDRYHKRETYTCKVYGCGEVFNKHRHLKTHRHEKHSQGRTYSCEVPGCGKTFPLPSKLKRHSKVHEGYKCKEPGCEANFVKWSLLVKHKRMVHNAVHSCPECKKVFSQKHWLKQHVKTHSDTRNMYVCQRDDCTRSYTDIRNLNAHIRSYHEGKRFPCEHEGCARTFVTKQKLKHHIKLHDPNRPLPKRKLKKRKSTAEKLTGVSGLVPEDTAHVTLTSPVGEDRIGLDISDLSYLHTEDDFNVFTKGAVGKENISADSGEVIDGILNTSKN